MSVNTFVASLARQFRSNPEIPGEKRAKSGWVGGWGVGGREVGLLAVLLSVFFSQMQAHSQGLWGGWAGSWATGCLALRVFQPNAGS